MHSRIENARRLRRNSTDAERRLWYHLRNRQLDGFRFRRQVPLGGFVADFACIEAALVIEIDGAQHVDLARADAERTRRLARAGYRVLRFWNTQVLQETEATLEAILRALHAVDAREGARMAERARMARALLQMSDCMASTRAFFED